MDYRTGGAQTSDVAVAYPNIKQLDQVIEAVKPRDGSSVPEATIPGVEGATVATFRPVVVTVEPVHMTRL